MDYWVFTKNQFQKEMVMKKKDIVLLETHILGKEISIKPTSSNPATKGNIKDLKNIWLHAIVTLQKSNSKCHIWHSFSTPSTSSNIKNKIHDLVESYS